MSHAPRARLARVSVPVALLVVSLVALAPDGASGARRYGRGDTGVVNISRTPEFGEAEEPLAVNPRNPNQIVAVANRWQRTFPGPAPIRDLPGANGWQTTVVYVSRDGGRSWYGGRLDQGGLGTMGSPLPPVLGFTASFDDAANTATTDAASAWDRHGNAYYESGSIHGINHSADEVATVWRSSDSGRTWPQRATAVSALQEKSELDRPWLAVDNSKGHRDGTVYVMFETSAFFMIPPEVYIKASTDHGKTWGPTRRVDDGLYTTQFNPRARPVVDAAGTLFVVYCRAPITMTPWTNIGQIELAVARSTDGGRTFKQIVVDRDVHRVTSPDEAMPGYTEMIAAIAADPKRPGRLAIAWPEEIDAKKSRIVMRYTTNGGRSWSPRIDVANDRVGRVPNQHDHVSLAWTQDGRLIASWRDRRCCGGTWDSKYQQWARIFVPRGKTLRPGRTIELTEGPQPVNHGAHGMLTPDEFQGLDSSGGYLFATWAQLVGEFTDVMFRRVPLSAFGR